MTDKILKPCPFCGEKYNLGVWKCDLEKFKYVYCATCGAHGPKGTMDEAVEKWNTLVVE